MSRTRTAPYSPEQAARRLAVKQSTAELCANLRSHGAKTATGRITPDRGTAKVTIPGTKVRVDVDVTVPDTGSVHYAFTDPATGDALVTDSVRDVRAVLAPEPSPLGRVVWRAALVTAISAVVIAVATLPLEDTKHFLAYHWLLLAGAVVVVDAVIVGGLELRRARRRRKAERAALTQLGAVPR